MTKARRTFMFTSPCSQETRQCFMKDPRTLMSAQMKCVWFEYFLTEKGGGASRVCMWRFSNKWAQKNTRLLRFVLYSVYDINLKSVVTSKQINVSLIENVPPQNGKRWLVLHLTELSSSFCRRMENTNTGKYFPFLTSMRILK